MKEVSGDLVGLTQEGMFDVIIHGCNCQCAMGAGIAKTIKSVFPQAYKADCQTVKGDRKKLGTISSVTVESNGNQITIVNAYTQFHWRGQGVKADYEAIRNCFSEIKKKYSGLSIAYPLIGAGLAGGDWNIISSIIATELKGEIHTLVKFKP